MATLKEIRDKAIFLGLANTSRLRKPELIRAVQEAEGNSPCFQKIPDCGQDDCLFFGDCRPQDVQRA